MDLLVTFTLSDRLFALLEDKLPNLGRRVERAINKELGAKVRQESNINITVKPTDPVEVADGAPNIRIAVKPTEPMEATEEVPETTQPAAEPKPFAEAPRPATEISIGERIREIMHRTRQRFEGEDYKENTDSEAYKKYHRALTSQFKQIAMQLGHEKPSYLDTAEKVDSFAEMCDALIIDEKGFIAPPPAPY